MQKIIIRGEQRSNSSPVIAPDVLDGERVFEFCFTAFDDDDGALGSCVRTICAFSLPTSLTMIVASTRADDNCSPRDIGKMFVVILVVFVS